MPAPRLATITCLLTLVTACHDGADSRTLTVAQIDACLRQADEIISFDRPNDPFSQIVWIGGGSDGAVYVAERFPPRIRVFDEAGTELASFVRQGQGPGEVRSIGAVKKLSNGDLLVSDVSGPKVARYDPMGRYVEELQIPSPGRMYANGFSVAHNKDEALLLLRQYTYRNPEGIGLARDERGRRILRWDLASDTLTALTTVVIPMFGMNGLADNTLLIPLSSGGAVKLRSHSDTVVWYQGDDSILVAIPDVGGREVTDAWLDSLRETLSPSERKNVDESPRPAQYARWQLDTPPDDKGRLWLWEWVGSWQYLAARREAQPGLGRWWVVTEQGPAQIVGIPLNVRVVNIEDNRIYGVRYDSLDVESAVVLSVPPPVRTPACDWLTGAVD